MKCRECGREVGNSFQLVCDFCTRLEEEYDLKCMEQADELLEAKE